MSTLVHIILVLTGGGAVLVMLLLSIPVGLDLRTGGGGTVLRLHWFFGLVRVRLVPGSDSGSDPGATRHDPGKQRGAAQRKRRRKRGLPSRPVVRRLSGVALRLIGRVRIVRCDLHLRLGTGDPADTGIIIGFLTPVAMALRNRGGAKIGITPDFGAVTVDLTGQVALRVVPITAVPPLLSLLADREVRRWLFARR